MQASNDDNWKPLESNPEVMNTYATKIGLNTEKYTFQDLLGFEDWAYEMIPQPVIGVVFNFPCKPVQAEFAKAQEQSIIQDGQQNSGNLFFMKQLAHNACGTIALVHVVFNALAQHSDLIKAESALDKFRALAQTQKLNPQEAGLAFKGATDLKEAHLEAVSEGQSDQCDEIDRHFIGFTLVDGHLYEFDGQKHFPINHGATTQATLLEDAAKVIKQFFDRDPQEVSFSTVVLARAPDDQ